jgi:hypothetical protein
MQTLDTLGAGFSVASHDMDIRGFGNLLGEEQSGHVKEVGIELYQAMLEEAIADMRTRRDMPNKEAETPDNWSPQINLGMSVLIPEDYVEDLSLRLSLYRRAAGLATNAELEGFAAELVDRFGVMPQELEHLISVLAIKLICNVHPWMSGYVHVFDHPFFAVSDKDGNFTISGDLPDGKYTVEANHLKSGTVTGEVEVKGGKASLNLELAVK